VGRLAPEKGFDYLIRAVAALTDAGVDVGLSILGDGPQQQELETLVSDLNLGDRVHLVGHVTNPKPYYESMDVYVLSSLREGLPNVLLEAMAYGIPLVATAVAGIPRLIDGESNGVLIPPSDAKSIADAITQLIHNPCDREKLGAGGRTTVEQRFCFQTRMTKIVDAYEQLPGSKRSCQQ
jgi:glycosyltransferase involved in cell wall biosynthesis